MSQKKLVQALRNPAQIAYKDANDKVCKLPIKSLNRRIQVDHSFGIPLISVWDDDEDKLVAGFPATRILEIL